MKNIFLKKISIKNFKGIQSLDISFKELTEILGANATGKSSVYDAITWLLFDKDSIGNSKFEVRQLDGNGDKIHHTEISVTGTIAIDGEDVVLSKAQKEKWVKKRGQEDQEYSGNSNEYSINGYPKSNKEFEAFIADIVDENIFKILTNPVTFPYMDWKEQRKILFAIAGDVDDADMEKEVEYFELIKPELAVASVDDIKKKWTKTKNDLKKKPDELQVRIDEVSSQIATFDVKHLEDERDGIEKEVETLKEQLLELDRKNNSDIDIKIRELRSDQKMAVERANLDRSTAISEAEIARNKAQEALDTAKRRRTQAEYESEQIQRGQDDKKSKIEEMLKTYNELKTQTFPEGKEICPTCGQKLPKDDIEKHRKEWTENHNVLLGNMKDSGNRLAIQLKELGSLLKKNSELLEETQKNLDIADKEWKKAEEIYDSALKTPMVDVTNIPDCIEIENQIKSLEAQRIDMDEVEQQKSSVKAQINDKQRRLGEIFAELSSMNENAKRVSRVEELQNELKEVGQKIADCEKILFAVESYVKAISRRINDKFVGLHFKLFENQINGGMKETCEITYEGVPYSSLNSGHRIVVGLNIIKVLRDYYKVTVPVIIDNAECISEGNLPQMDGQMILLKVTDDKTLIVS